VSEHSWLPIDLAAIEDRPAVTPSLGGLGLTYPGRAHVRSGPPESAKTLIAYIEALTVSRVGDTVVLVDFEMGRWDARDRLRDLGATDADLAKLLYVEPETPASTADIDALVALRPVLVILDAAASLYEISDLDDNKRKDVETFSRLYLRAFRQADIASIVLDHVGKVVEARGKFAIGSERKVGGADVHLGFEALKPLQRGGAGLVKVTTHKDRLGHLPRPTAALIRLESDPDTHAITWTIEHETADDAHGEGWRPTVLMERISRRLEEDGPIGKTALANSVHGNRSYRFRAIDFLIADGHAKVDDGGNIASLKPYREPTASSQPSETSQVPQVPTVPSGSRNGSHAGGDPSGSKVPRSSMERELGTEVADAELE
jgi:hypothetical protein